MNFIINQNLNEISADYVPISCYYNFLHHLLICLGYPAQKPPLAELLSKYHGLNGEWLIVSPINWHATFNDVTITKTDVDLKLSETESRAIFAALQKEFSEITWHYHDQYTWLIQTTNTPPITSQPPRLIRNTSFGPHLKNLDDTLYWQKFITESQFLLNNCKHPEVNGIWIWGQGSRQVNHHKKIIYDDPILLPFINLLSDNIEKIGNKVNRQAIVVLQDANNLTNFQPKHASWYWNNCAYQKKPTSFIKRIWEKIQNAN